MTILIALAFLAILASLGAALVFMIRSGKSSDPDADPAIQQPATPPKPANGMARALAFRVGISVVLFICVLVSWKMGWINPTGIPSGK